MKPPIKVAASTDNQRHVTLTFSAEGSDETFKAAAPHAGSAYQTAHALAPLVEAAVNGILALHGIAPPQPKAPKAPRAKKEKAAPAPKKKARAKKS